MLYVHRSERADPLVRALAALLADAPADPLTADVVSVPTRGVERWLAQSLSSHLGTSAGRTDGICANVDFPFPAKLVGDALTGATGIEPRTDPWLPQRAVWPLLDVLQDLPQKDVFGPVRAALGGEHARRFGIARHIADLFDRYGVHRPGMVLRWHSGDDVFEDGRPLPDDHRWQSPLWRVLRERIGIASPAERLAEACARIEADPALTDLPERVSIFGLTRLPASYLAVLRAVAKHRDVHLFLLHPSAAHWERDEHDARNPLLESWGRDAREMQLVLGTAGEQLHHAVDEQPTALLQRLQHDVREDRAPDGDHHSDTTVQVHACHGRARQVEVMRDAILRLLADDPTLEPRDVIVMCPDIEAFAPLIHATFGAHETAGRPDVRVRLADRSIRQTNPVLAVLSELLDLASARLTAPEVLDFAAREPVRRRFRFDDDDLDQIEQWVRDTNTRWGLDAAHRLPYRLDGVTQNTWRFGLDRLLTGVVASAGRVGDVLPLEDVESTDIDLAGRFAEFVARFGAAIDALAGPHTASEWASVLDDASLALTAVPDDDAWQQVQVRRILSDVADESAGSTAALLLDDTRALLADRLRGRPTTANFRTGHLTVCTLVPMRSVPHRVVCLLGLDDGVFPRTTVPDGDDLVASDRRPGDRDPRTEDRQLLLDALLAATDHLVVTYSGRDERTNAPLPPAVPLGELLDVIDATVRPANGTRPRDSIVVHHSLQPFDPSNFRAADPRSFDQVALGGARALAGPRHEKPPFLAAPLAPEPAPVIALDDLIRFVQHPVRAFLRQRLGVWLGQSADDVPEGLPIDLDNLQQWGLGDRMLAAHLGGMDLDDCCRDELARGGVPPGRLAYKVVENVKDEVAQLASLAQRTTGSPRALDVDVTLPDGRSVTGVVSGVRDDTVFSVSYSRLGPRDRLASWARFVAATAAHPADGLDALAVGRAPWRGQPCARVDSMDAGAALGHLSVLVDLYDRGMREPLPLYCRTSAAFALAPDDASRAAEGEWVRAFGKAMPGENEDPAHVFAYGGHRALGDVLAEAPRDDERWNDDDSRFGQYAHRLWDPVAASQRLEAE